MSQPASSSSMSTDTYENHLYLSSNDHMTLQLVSHQLTGAENYNVWHRSITMALEGRNKLGYVNGNFFKPSDDHPDAKLWSQNNAVVRSWILNSVSPAIASTLMFISSASAMWQTIINRYQQHNAPRLYDIHKRLHSLAQGSSNVTTYFTNLVSIWEELKTVKAMPICSCQNCHCQVSKKWMDDAERDFVIKFLFGLSETFEHTRGQILMMDPLPDLQHTYNLVIQHEHQLMIKTTLISDAVTFQASSTSNTDGIVSEVSKNASKLKSRPLCTHCGLYGHTIQKCYKLRCYPPGHRNSNTGRSPSISARPLRPAHPLHRTVADINSPDVVLPSFSASNTLPENQVQQLADLTEECLKLQVPSFTRDGANASSSEHTGNSGKFPAMRFGGNIVYSKTASEVDRSAKQLLKILETMRKQADRAVIGFDIEWKPNFIKGVPPRKAATVQICVDANCCHVLHIIHSGIPESLQCLLEDSTIVKVGVGIDGDSVKLFHDYGVSVKETEDLSNLANKKVGKEERKKWGLASLTQMFVSKEVLKPRRIRLGNWEVDVLSKAQLQYAATDAFASWHLYQVLKGLPDVLDCPADDAEAH